MSSKLISVKLVRRNWDLIIDALQAVDNFTDDEKHTASTMVKMEIVSQLDHFCDSTAGRHVMIKPEDTNRIQWGEFGICTECFVVRKMPVKLPGSI